MLIIEGPDMVGKTTLAAKVRNALYAMGEPTAHIKFGMESAGKMTPAYLAPRINRWTVADRMHLSEVLYSIGRGDAPKLSPQCVLDVNAMLRSVDAMIVVVWASDSAYSKLVDKHHSRGEQYDRDTCKRVNSLYRHVANSMRYETVHGFYDFALQGRTIVWQISDDRLQMPSDKFAISIAEMYAARQRGRV